MEPRVDFYVIDDPGGSARLSLACKLAEKAYLASQSVLIWHSEPAELKALDEMLWTFRDGSFVPHEVMGAEPGPREAPVLLSAGPVPAGDLDVVINLAPGVPDFAAQSKRIIEIIDGDESRRRAGRARWEAYRKRGVQPASHNL
jgi:DNA polymerase-3 subunit chi